MLQGVTLDDVRGQLRKERLSRNWSLDDLAEKSTVNRSTIHDVETNRDGHPAFETVAKMVEGLGLTLVEFFARIEGSPEAPSVAPPPRTPEDVAASFLDAVDRMIAARMATRSELPAEGTILTLTLPGPLDGEQRQSVQEYAERLARGQVAAPAESTTPRRQVPTDKRRRRA